MIFWNAANEALNTRVRIQKNACRALKSRAAPPTEHRDSSPPVALSFQQRQVLPGGWRRYFVKTPLIEADGFGGDGVEFAAAVIKGISPRDQLEAMLGAQMAVMHWASMKCMWQVADRRGTQFEECAVAMATKLARTFAAEMEVLKRYRSGGKQKVTVQHVVEKRGRSIGCDAHKIAQAGVGGASG